MKRPKPSPPPIPRDPQQPSLPFRCPRCERMGVRAQGVVAPICEACATAWGVKRAPV